MGRPGPGGSLVLLDAIPPVMLLLLNGAILVSIARRASALPHPRLALTCAIAPLLYAIGMLLYLAKERWLPGVAVGAVGTLAVPTAVACALFVHPAARTTAITIAAAAWVAVWLAPHPEGWTLRTSALIYACTLAALVVLAATGLKRGLSQRSSGGLERRIFILCLPFFLIGLGYMLLRGAAGSVFETQTRPVFSTCIHVGAEIVLLLLVSRDEQEADLPSTLPALVLQALLLTVGALLILVLAANLRIFPKAPVPLIVGALTATFLALGYGVVRPTLDVLLREALYPEAHAAEQRLRALQTELDEAQTRLRQAEHLSLVGQLAAQVAHEIKNPLGPIKGYTKIIEREVLKSGALSEKVQRGIEIIRQEVDSIDARAKGLLELARPPQPHTTDVDFAALGQDVLDLVASDCPPHVRLAWATRPDAAPGRADPVLLRSALTNVIQNAIQVLADKPGAITLDLHQIDDDAGRRWELFVDDDGPGLPTDTEPEELFRPFVSHREGGSGLGLVISRGSLRAMSGDLELRRLESGTRAVFQFPADSPPEPQPQEAA